MLPLLQRQPDHLRRIFGHGRATADLMDANDPIRSDQLQHDPPLHPELPATTTGQSHSTPTFWTVSIVEKGRTAWQKATGYGRRSLVETAIGRYKHIIGSTLRARSTDGQGGEAAITVQVLNRMIRIAKSISVRRT